MNAQIYVQRSRQMKQAGTRTRLLAWIMSDLELIALADPSIHGPEKVVNIMTEIDSDSLVHFKTCSCLYECASKNEMFIFFHFYLNFKKKKWTIWFLPLNTIISNLRKWWDQHLKFKMVRGNCFSYFKFGSVILDEMHTKVNSQLLC